MHEYMGKKFLQRLVCYEVSQGASTTELGLADRKLSASQQWDVVAWRPLTNGWAPGRPGHPACSGFPLEVGWAGHGAKVHLFGGNKAGY